jgi:hypothetical protein
MLEHDNSTFTFLHKPVSIAKLVSVVIEAISKLITDDTKVLMPKPLIVIFPINNILIISHVDLFYAYVTSNSSF